VAPEETGEVRRRPETQARRDLRGRVLGVQEEPLRLENWACLEKLDINSGGFDVV
jgi:hypothetical protein